MTTLMREVAAIDRPRVSDVAVDVAARAAAIERSRRVPADLIASLKAAGLFRMLVPTAYGGAGLALVDVLRVLESLSAADGATGWLTGQVASAQLLLSYFPRRTLDLVYADGPDVLGAGAVAPKGAASPDRDGWRVTGQWPFVTGCEDASWIYVQAVVAGVAPERSAADAPPLRLLLFPRDEVRILDTWSVSGLRGTGSHDVRFSRSWCPDWRTTTIVAGSTPNVDDAIFQISPLDQGGLYIAAVSVGIAQGALDDIEALATSGKRPAFSTKALAASESFQERLGEAFMQLQSARALLYAQADAAWTAACAGAAVAAQGRAVRRATVSTVMAACVGVVDAAYSLGGGTALYESSPLQRRFRDIHAAAQHAYANRRHFGVLGGVLAGEAPDPALF
jgi:alkylation response protein AidB-like acyl-CoA dehydrogenase